MRRLAPLISATGLVSLISGIVLFFLIFAQAVNQEIRFVFDKPDINTAVIPVDENFGIVIPKIAANAKIIPNVDPYNSSIYQQALTKGVALAKGTAYPNTNGNMFLFSHSSVNFYEASKYNSVFYLLSKMEKGDEIFIYFNHIRYIYRVSDKKIVDANEVSYLQNSKTGKTLTLMTCWPAGTTFKRLLIIGEQQK